MKVDFYCGECENYFTFDNILEHNLICPECGSDKIGEIDDGMMEICKEFKRHGFITEFSCSGHYNESIVAPYLGFKVIDDEKYSRKMKIEGLESAIEKMKVTFHFLGFEAEYAIVPYLDIKENNELVVLRFELMEEKSILDLNEIPSYLMDLFRQRCIIAIFSLYANILSNLENRISFVKFLEK